MPTNENAITGNDFTWFEQRNITDDNLLEIDEKKECMIN
jgi:hypothetical protein